MSESLYGFNLKLAIIDIVNKASDSMTIVELEAAILQNNEVQSFQRKAVRQRIYNAVRSLDKEGYLQTNTKLTRLKTTYILISKISD